MFSGAGVRSVLASSSKPRARRASEESVYRIPTAAAATAGLCSSYIARVLLPFRNSSSSGTFFFIALFKSTAQMSALDTSDRSLYG